MIESIRPRALPATLLAPWAITEEGLKLCVSIASRDSFFAELRQKALQAREGTPLENTKTVTIRGGVAVIPVAGPLFRHAGLMTAISGASSYEDIRKDLQTALNNDDVKSIIFDIDSPGGEVHGCGELSSAIYAARGKKTIKAYVSGMMCSAAYWIGSACDEIVTDASGMLGSIGVKTMMVDDSKAQETAGVIEYVILSSGAPFKSPDAANSKDRARVKDTLNAMEAVFVSDVARNRGISPATVLSDFGQGDVLVGKLAQAVGLADRLGDFESLLSELSTSNQEGIMKPVTQKDAPAPAATMGKAKCDGCDRDMDDDDDTYCRACHADVDASAGVKQFIALTGKANLTEALATVAGWKQAASEIGEMKAELAKQEQAAQASAFEAAVSQAKSARLLAVSDEHKRNVTALSYKGKPGALESLASFLSALDPLSAPSASEAALPPSIAPIAASPSAHGLSAETVKIILASGSTVEKFLSQRDALKKLTNPSVEE